MSARWRIWWTGLGPLRWPTLLLPAVALVLSVVYEPVPWGWRDHGAHTLGEAEAKLFTRGRVRAGRDLELRLELSRDASFGLEIVEGPRVRVEPERDPESESHAFETSLAVPPGAERVVIRLFDARFQEVRWDLGRPR
ncbi:MAG: hypothetical protein AAF430_01095 [Myxococcota bacterium]